MIQLGLETILTPFSITKNLIRTLKIHLWFAKNLLRKIEKPEKKIFPQKN